MISSTSWIVDASKQNIYKLWFVIMLIVVSKHDDMLDCFNYTSNWNLANLEIFWNIWNCDLLLTGAVGTNTYNLSRNICPGESGELLHNLLASHRNVFYLSGIFTTYSILPFALFSTYGIICIALNALRSGSCTYCIECIVSYALYLIHCILSIVSYAL